MFDRIKKALASISFNSDPTAPVQDKQALTQQLVNKFDDQGNLKRPADQDFMMKLATLGRTVERQELQDWQAARALALNQHNPNRNRLMMLYADTMHDLHLKAAIRNRKSRILNKHIIIRDDDGSINEDKSRVFESAWVRNALDAELDVLFWGYSLLWFGGGHHFQNGQFKDFWQVYRQNVNPDYCIINEHAGINKGVSFEDERLRDWIIFSCLANKGDEEHLGKLNSVAAYTITKRYSWANWNDLEQRFGVPIAFATSANTDKKFESKIFNWLKTLTQSSSAVFPQGVDIQVLEAQNRDVYQLFNEKIARVNSEISKDIEGQTSTLDPNKQYKPSEVHERTSQSITADDMNLIKTRVEGTYIPFLIKHGYNFTGDERFEFEQKEVLSKEQRIGFALSFTKEGYRFNADQIENLLGLEIEAEPLEEVTTPSPLNQKKKTSPVIAKQVNKLYNSRCSRCEGKLTAEGETDIDNERLEREFLAAAREIWEGNEVLIHEGLWESVVDTLTVAYSEGVALVDNVISEELATALTSNIQVFSGFKTYQELKTISEMLVDDSGRVKPWALFRDEVLSVNNLYNKHWLKSEYQHAVASAQSAAAWEDYEAQSDVFDLQYITAGDSRVRREHEALDRIIRPVNDPFWRTAAIPNGWNCRCWHKQVEGEPLTDQAEALRKADKAHRNDMFKFNPAQDKILFPEKHPYYNTASSADQEGVSKFLKDKEASNET